MIIRSIFGVDLAGTLRGWKREYKYKLVKAEHRRVILSVINWSYRYSVSARPAYDDTEFRYRVDDIKSRVEAEARIEAEVRRASQKHPDITFYRLQAYPVVDNGEVTTELTDISEVLSDGEWRPCEINPEVYGYCRKCKQDCMKPDWAHEFGFESAWQKVCPQCGREGLFEPAGERVEPSAYHELMSGQLLDADRPSCWIWGGRTDASGYGRIVVGQQMKYCHRVAYETFVGDIPEGLNVYHHCGTPACINPDHLVVSTAADNLPYRFPDTPPEEEFSEIKRALKKGSTLKKLAEYYRVSTHTIYTIARGEPGKLVKK